MNQQMGTYPGSVPGYVPDLLEEHLRRNDIAHRSTCFMSGERIAGNQAQHRRVCVENEAAATGVDDVDACNLIKVFLSFRCFEEDGFTFLHVLQKLEMRVAMSGNNCVAGFTG